MIQAKGITDIVFSGGEGETICYFSISSTWLSYHLVRRTFKFWSATLVVIQDVFISLILYEFSLRIVSGIFHEEVNYEQYLWMS